ncbi:hypothetical protein EJ08DRAFT_592055 [Tothia fuscella]|uniref:Uncharacterized protein n=1 Tax=Tothia fuscella TaxID=1048955 RepID=A0A9P4TXB3_9PEZI|nr:hypothetical protein EJ08DRAFT_592055 [Tothia fuscella]
MSEEDKKKAKGIAGTILDGSGNVIGGLAGTVGGVLKGVGDTTGNTVYALGSGLAQTGTGAVSGLADTAKAAGGVKTGPRKIEVRNQKQEEDVKEKLGDKKDEVEVENVGEKGGKKVEKGKSS